MTSVSRGYVHDFESRKTKKRLSRNDISPSLTVPRYYFVRGFLKIVTAYFYFTTIVNSDGDGVGGGGGGTATIAHARAHGRKSKDELCTQGRGTRYFHIYNVFSPAA